MDLYYMHVIIYDHIFVSNIFAICIGLIYAPNPHSHPSSVPDYEVIFIFTPYTMNNSKTLNQPPYMGWVKEHNFQEERGGLAVGSSPGCVRCSNLFMGGVMWLLCSQCSCVGSLEDSKVCI